MTVQISYKLMTKSPYLEIAKQGKNIWWHYPMVIILTIMFTTLAILVLTGISLSELQSITSKYPTQTKTVVTIMIPGLIAMGGFFGALFQHFHQRNIFTVINLEGFIRWKYILFSCVLWFILQPPMFIVSFLLDSSRYSVTLDFQQWFSITPFAISIALFLSSCLFSIFIGYIFQASSLLIPKPQYLIPLLGLILGYSRTNTNFFSWSQSFALAFLLYSFLLLIILKDNGIELIIGIVFVNRIISDLIINNSDNMFDIAHIISISAPYDWTINLIFPLLNYFIFYFICDKKFKWGRKI